MTEPQPPREGAPGNGAPIGDAANTAASAAAPSADATAADTPAAGAPAAGAALPEHYFRHEFGKLVAVLSRRFGMDRLELCEDAVQTALLRAVQTWSQQGPPDNPSGWLFRVAQNEVLGALRRDKHIGASLDDESRMPADGVGDTAARGCSGAVGSGGLGVGGAGGGPSATASPIGPADETIFLRNEVTDAQLRMLFVCADPAIPRESQMVLALKTLCGFSVDEIALRLFQNTEAVYKRLQRARATLRDQWEQLDEIAALDTPSMDALTARLPAVLHIVYLLFTEGYSSSQAETVIRRELVEEAVRLGLLIVEHPVGAVPETDALLALMYLDAARFDARVDGAGGLLLLEEQDRARWDRDLIERGIAHLHRAARGDVLSRYHVEAAIAAEHCLAPAYADTRWNEIARLYEWLDGIAPSPINTLNRSIAVAEWQGPAAGLTLLESLKPPPWLLGYYLWDATLGELHRRNGDPDRARIHLTRALDAAPTNAEKALIRRRLDACVISA